MAQEARKPTGLDQTPARNVALPLPGARAGARDVRQRQPWRADEVLTRGPGPGGDPFPLLGCAFRTDIKWIGAGW